MTSSLTSITLITAAEDLPVTLADAKLHMRVSHTAEDTIIAGYLAAATALVQKRTRRQLVEAAFELSMDGFLSVAIELPLPPCISVDAITYIDTDGQAQTLAESAYQVDVRSTFARVLPAIGTSWPSIQASTMASVVIAFTAGYGDPADVPDPLKLAIKLLAASWFEHREAVATTTVNEVPLAVETLLGMYTLPEVW